MGFIFDMGNVLSLDVDVLPCMAAALGMTIGEIADYAAEDFAKLLVGAKTAEEFWRGFNRHFGTDVRDDLLISCFQPSNDPRMERLILDLKTAGHRVVCGTNAFEKHYRYHLERGDYAVFDRVYASNVMGLAKPSPAFYQHILVEEGWQARDTFFIDDRAANVEAARRLGMRVFLYASPRSFPGLLQWLADGKAEAHATDGAGPTRTTMRTLGGEQQ